ncbi:hypothetical protein THRCLA_09064 [Thraustotheca clavata]|uniref:Guanylate cyclase domain-containing protein n=1 Tax=Thraustotheca clavata TaxID=74557 RepID=A0A1V9YZJ3_9STRA|nr:hypothetical protein THRCLA_09064 [Thraustotheca clavata]
MHKYDVVVLGVGAMGSSTCYHLAKQGYSVLGLEQYEMAHAFGSSHGKTRMVRKAYFEHPNYVPLLQRSYELWDQLAKEYGRQLFHRSGVLLLGPEAKGTTELDVLECVRESARQHKLPIENLSREECQNKFPMFKVPQGFVGVFEADAGYVEVEASIVAHIELARKEGAQLHFNEKVHGWIVNSDQSITITTDNASYTAKKLIITAGAWTNQVLKASSVELKVHRVPLFWFPPKKEMNVFAESNDTMPCFAVDSPYGFVYGFPFVNGEGVKVAPHLPGAVLENPSALHRAVLPGEIDPVVNCVNDIMPELQTTPSESAVCMYTMTKDGHFIIDKHPSYQNVVFAAGFSGHGYKFAPVIGEILSDLSIKGSTRHPVDFLRIRNVSHFQYKHDTNAQFRSISILCVLNTINTPQRCTMVVTSSTPNSRAIPLGGLKSAHLERNSNSSNTPPLIISSTKNKIQLSEPQRIVPRRKKKRQSYTPFRTTCFVDKHVMPENHEPSVPLTFGSESESIRLWASKGPRLGTAPKLDIKTGAMYSPMVDQIYDTGKQSFGYRVHQSLSGSTLWNTTERFIENPTTSERVGPGSYNSITNAWEKQRSIKKYPALPPSPQKRNPFQSPLKDPRPTQVNEMLAPLDNWKLTTKAVSPLKVPFDRAEPRSTLIMAAVQPLSEGPESFKKLQHLPSERRLSDQAPTTEHLAPQRTESLKRSIQRRSFLRHDGVAPQTFKVSINDFNPSKSHTLIDASKVVQSYLGGPHSGQQAYSSAMHPYTLRFLNDHLEDLFRQHYRHYVLGKVRMACFLSIALHLMMGVLEFCCGYTSSREAQIGLVITRAVAIAITGMFYIFTYRPCFQKYFELVMMTHYMLLNLLVISASLVVQLASDGTSDASLYFFYAGRWSQAISLIFIAMLFNSTGLMFKAATTIASLHSLLMIVIPVIFYTSNSSLFDAQIAFGPILTGFCTLSTHHNERTVRMEFVMRYNVADDRKRRDDLLETMLPANIKENLKENLKENRTDSLAEQYDEVSILFCYVSDFGQLSKSTPAIELVQLMNRIFFCFDKATDARGVYKVEAIAETYMCAAGVPVKDPYHHEKIADMALMMMYIQQQEKWQCQGQDIQLKIGIHSGPVVAGVIGSKTYSYHLFGDTVNTSSRVCSSCLPGRIQISSQTYELLKHSGCYEMTLRGKVALKGKGELILYWLQRKIASPERDLGGLTLAFDLAQEKAITTRPKNSESSISSLTPSGSVPTDILLLNPRTLTFQLRPEVVVPQQLGRMYAANMETSFMFKYNITNIGQFRASLRIGMFVLILTTALEVAPSKLSTPTTRYYTLAFDVTALLVLMVLLAYSHFQLFLVHLQSATAMAMLLVISLLNGNLLFQRTRNFLTVNIIYIVIVSVLLRFRFTISLLVNAFNIGLYIAYLKIIDSEVINIIGYFCVTLFCFGIGQHACYRREIGLRMDFLLKHTLNTEKRKCEELLANMLPSQQYAEALLLQGTIVDELEEVTLLYSDMVGFTALSSTLKPVESCLFLNKVYSAFDKHLDSFGVYKMDTVGDAFIVIGGLPDYKSQKNHAIAITAFAVEMLREMETFRQAENVNLQMRIGIHSGKAVGGVVGIKKPRYLIWGSQTVIANAMESKSLPGHIQISAATHAKLADCDEFKFIPRGSIAIDDSQSIETYFLNMAQAPTKATIIGKYFATLPCPNGRRTSSEQNLNETIRKAKEENPFFDYLEQSINGTTWGDTIKTLLKMSSSDEGIN